MSGRRHDRGTGASRPNGEFDADALSVSSLHPGVDEQRLCLAELARTADRLREALLGAGLRERVLSACDDVESAVRRIRRAYGLTEDA